MTKFEAIVIVAIVIFIMILALPQAHCSNLPDAPSNSKKSWIAFTAVAVGDLAFSAYDTHITEVGINSGKGCYEANPALVGKYPHAGALYAKNMGISGGLIFAGFAMKKWLHLPIAPYAAMGIDAGKHAHGVFQWYHFKDGACL